MQGLYSKKVISELLAELNLAPLKKFGQNFLCDENIVEMIADKAVHGDYVIEIGPGLGVLTDALSRRCKKVVAIEIDEGMVRALNKTLSDRKNVHVVHNDILKTDIREVAMEHFGTDTVCVVGNLPYYITAKCIMHVLESKANVLKFTAMVQREVARRLSSKEGEADYGALTASVAYYGGAKEIIKVSSDCFLPKPEVESSVIQITPDKVFDVEREKYAKTVRGLFAMRRKTLLNNMKSSFSISADRAEALLTECGIDPRRRAETLSPSEFARLAALLFH
ncbi:MAG: 16S rRNA (adenine(1518)-N(6)/adenine(1519)-N(6))-dimethyltransferase RsmA [Lachnospiraceae bacterium]